MQEDRTALSKTNMKKQHAHFRDFLPLSSSGRTKRVVLLHGNGTITTTSWLSSCKLRTVDRPAMPVSSPVSVACVPFFCKANVSRCCLLCDDLFSLRFFPLPLVHVFRPFSWNSCANATLHCMRSMVIGCVVLGQGC